MKELNKYILAIFGLVGWAIYELVCLFQSVGSFIIFRGKKYDSRKTLGTD
jgi:hypothetical protein